MNPTNLKAALSRFETQLETPVVPGELTAWLQAAQRMIERVVPMLRADCEQRQRELLEKIAEQDQDLLSCVAQLKEESQHLEAESQRQAKAIARLVRRSESLEPDESRGDRALDKIVVDGLQLVIRIRKQDAALNTWFMESLERDLGVGD